MDNKGYYKTLGVKENASEDEIKRAYRKLSAKYHPDRNVGKSDKEKAAAEEKFKEINEAYQTLGDPDKRKEYDNPYSGGFGGGGFGANFDGFGNFNFGQGFNDVFNSVFGGGHRTQQNANYKRQAVKGGNIQMKVLLTLEEIYSGCTKKFKYNKNVRCATCHGNGGIGAKKDCPHCNGTGRIYSRQQTPFGMISESRSCPHCNGLGYVYNKKCPTCGGSGFTTKENIIEVKFPAGIMRGEVLIQRGEGHESKDHDGANGDCMIIVDYNYDETKYNVQGLDIVEKIYIPYYDALLGCDYTLEMPDGNKKKINIVTCTPNGKMLRLSGEGIKSGSIKGNYYLEINYTFPETLGAEERKKLEDIKVIYYNNENKE